MSTSITVILGGIVVLLIIWQLLAASSKKASAAQAQLRSRDSGDGSFRSVGIDVGKQCCRAATNIRGERYLINQAPPLPLAACDSTTCRCKYIHFADRRTADDDRRDFPAPPSMLANQDRESERRKKQDRRQD
jgi:hypothetical protein